MSPPARTTGMPGCDLVMKGGIASGIVYPRAIGALARRYRLHSIGGSSAGAIAAAAAAAAEFRRQEHQDPAGFDVLDELPGELGAPGMLVELFRPEGGTRAVWDVIEPVLEHGSKRSAVLLAVGRLLQMGNGWTAAVATLTTAVAVLAALGSPHWGVAIPAALVAIALGLVVALLGSVVVFLALADALLSANLLGICSGVCSKASLTNWLDAAINRIAGLDAGSVLTVGQLRNHDIDLQVMTTALSHSRPYRLPFQRGEKFFFLPEELRRVFPKHVVAHMERAGREQGGAIPASPAGLVPFPEADALPVLVALRMSLSFPVLISAVPLWAVDRGSNGDGPGVAERCWFSDGGICLNFPVHLFDAPIPRRPTYCINLRYPGEHGHADAAVKTDTDKRVEMARGNGQGWEDLWYRPGKGDANMLWLLLAMLGALRKWADLSRSRMPGFRDRIAHVNLASDEGGLHLYMPRETIAGIAGAGAVAGQALGDQFIEQQTEYAGRTGWDNHRWLRYRATMAQLESWLLAFRRGMASDTGDFLSTEAQRPRDQQVSYRWVTSDQRDLAEAGTEALQQLADQWWHNAESPENVDAPGFLQEGAPRPRAELCARPRI